MSNQASICWRDLTSTLVEVPWWNEVVTGPKTKLPKTMKYLRENFEGEEWDFRVSQILRGLKKGSDEMIKMTTRYLMKTPLIFCF